MMLDGKAFGEQVVGIVKAYIDKAFAPIVDRMNSLEKRIDDLPEPKEFDSSELRAGLETEIAELKAIIAALPPTPELPDFGCMVAEAVAALPPPQDGKSVTVDELRPVVDDVVANAIKAIPAAEDGEPGNDGVGLAGAMIDRDGNLVVTLSNGETKELGIIVGEDGDPGKPGADGLGFDDLDVVHDGARGFTFRFARGDQVKEFPFTLPVVLDKGVYKAADDYEPGDGVTYGGSFWIAQEKTQEKPDSGKGWRLAVKRGRDGKSAPVVAAGPKEPIRVGVPAKAN